MKHPAIIPIRQPDGRYVPTLVNYDPDWSANGRIHHAPSERGPLGEWKNLKIIKERSNGTKEEG